MSTCHCGRTLSPDHFGSGDSFFDKEWNEQHAIRCCACVDSFLCGASDCLECDTAGFEDTRKAIEHGHD